MSGPLTGYRVIEVAGLGAAPFGAMVLADLGADVIRVDRASAALGGDPASPPVEPLNRGRRSIAIDLKQPGGAEVILRMVESSHVLIEGFRPGVAERLGIGPEDCMARNPTLVYGRMTGWGQSGPLAQAAGHDIDYIALSGVLGRIGVPAGGPIPPLNLLGDFGGGGMLLAMGVLAALLETVRSGQGQVVDAAMVDGSALLSTMIHGFAAQGLWTQERGRNLLDGGAPFYRTYESKDGGYMAVGALEPQFFSELLRLLDVDPSTVDPDRQMDPTTWPSMITVFSERFLRRTRAEWQQIFEGTDACVAPVLTFDEAYQHPANVARHVFVDVGGVVQPAPAPRFSRTGASAPAPPPHPGQDTDALLGEFGFEDADIQRLRSEQVVR